MSIQVELIRYLNTIRKDTKDKRRIDTMKALIASYKNSSVQETQALSRQIAGFISHLFQQMPEIAKADPHYKKIYPLYTYCDQLPKAKKPTKKPRF